MRRRTPKGVTLLETLLVLALLALLAASAARAWTPTAAERAARAYAADVRALRAAAIAGGTGAIRWAPDAGRFLVWRGGPDLAAHVGEARSATDRVAPPAGVAVVRTLRDGVRWTPDGSGRAFAGGGVYGGRVRFAGPHATWDVVVASSGRLRLAEVAP
ncbi:MAG: prepilin-type N-terminal cleavage/methylation domain-containing protein [Trueperaceae bacterium]|nr:prepilin-type N-terminal cleavage/methylation domain-containing protein [Trueperaceae bacterium]